MVRNPGPCSSSLATGIIPSSEPSPHWLASRLGFSFRLGPWHHGYCFLGMADSSLVVWLFIELFGLVVGALARRCKRAEYIIKQYFGPTNKESFPF